MTPFLSICIPAYKRTDYLKRLLDSILIQTYTDFEVIVTDDSPGKEVEELCRFYESQLSLLWFKNERTLDTPENWNESIRRASGQWIKLMHDDDWFGSAGSLQQFADAIRSHPEKTFFFSAYANIYEGTERREEKRLNRFWKKALLQDANVLIADNVVGPPSVILHKNDKQIWYDHNMKYVVDIDFYIRYLEKRPPVYINQTLINVGINAAQVTKYTFNVPEVHLKESLLLLQKTGEAHLKNMIVFDGWWRLIRNFRIDKEENLAGIGYKGPVPMTILRMINFQRKFPSSLLKVGVFSKLTMFLCYILHSGKIRPS